MRSTDKIRICLSFPRLFYCIPLLSASLCEETTSAKSTLRIPLLTDTCKNTTSLEARRDKTARSECCEYLSMVFHRRGLWQPFDLRFNVSDPGCTDQISTPGLMKSYLHDFTYGFSEQLLVESHHKNNFSTFEP